MMRIGDAGIALIREFEGCDLDAYPDPGTGGDPWTVGFGHTGSEVCAGLTITQERADELLREDLAKFEKCVSNAVKVDIDQNQFDALCSFAFNVGCENLRKSTLLRMLNDGDDAGPQFMRWNRANKKVMAGLTRRRQAEMELFMSTEVS